MNFCHVHDLNGFMFGMIALAGLSLAGICSICYYLSDCFGGGSGNE